MLLGALLLAAGCAAQAPPPPPPRAQPRVAPLPGLSGERQNPHRLMMLADNELDLCRDGTGAERRDACRRRTAYVDRAKRLGWCLAPGGPDLPVPSWTPCPRRS